MILLYYMGTQSSDYAIAHKFGVSDSTVFLCIRQMVNIIYEDLHYVMIMSYVFDSMEAKQARDCYRASVLLIWNKKVWAIKYWQYFYCIGTCMAHTCTRRY